MRRVGLWLLSSLAVFITYGLVRLGWLSGIMNDLMTMIYPATMYGLPLIVGVIVWRKLLKRYPEPEKKDG